MEKKQQKQLYSQNELAERLGISKGSLSKWLRKNSVSPKTVKGQRKYYDETVAERFEQERKTDNNAVSKRLTRVELLQQELDQKQQEINGLKDQIKKKDDLIEKQAGEVVEFAKKFATLADQAQKLNLADKDVKKLESKEERKTVSDNEEKQEQIETVKRSFWQKIFKK